MIPYRLKNQRNGHVPITEWLGCLTQIIVVMLVLTVLGFAAFLGVTVVRVWL